MVFRDSVSPRVDIADSLFVYEIHNGRAIRKEVCRLAYERPEQLVAILHSKGVSTVVCGGCPRFFLKMFRFNSVEVAPGMTGDPEAAAQMVAAKKPGFAPGDCFPGGRWLKEGKMKQGKVVLFLCILAVLLHGTARPVNTIGATGQAGATAGMINSIGMPLILVPAGTFQMGLAEKFRSPCMENAPRHKVIISRPFYIGKYEVTQEQWLAVMGENPSKFRGKDNPVERVSWREVQVFIEKLNKMEKTAGYRLPTEAEWEYACRGGSDSLYYFGDSEDPLPRHAWIFKNSQHRTHPVGRLEANGYGLHDTLGNVWEWCRDTYQRDYYRDSPVRDPIGPKESSHCRVMRGGSWHSISPYRLRSSFRFYYSFNGKLSNVGFRLVKRVK